jgi:hypothetical protein
MHAIGAAGLAAAASVVNLSGDTSSVVKDTEKLVAEDSAESHVATGELEIGVADPCAADANEDLARRGVGLREVAAEVGGLAVAEDAAHEMAPVWVWDSPFKKNRAIGARSGVL